MDDPAVRGQPNSVAVCTGTVLLGFSWAEPHCGASPMLFIVPRVQLGRDRVAVSPWSCHVLCGAGVLGAAGRRPRVGSHGNLRGRVYLASARSHVPNNLFGSDLGMRDNGWNPPPIEQGRWGRPTQIITSNYFVAHAQMR